MKLRTEGEFVIDGLPSISVREIDAIDAGGMVYIRWRTKWTLEQLGKVFSEIKKLF